MLLEAAVALLIIGLVAGATLDVYAAEMRAATREPRLLSATVLAQDRLAAVRILEPEQLARLPDSLARGRFDSPFADFRWHASTARARDGDLYDVRVEVTWSGGVFTLVSRVFAPAAGGSGQ
jgi:type II secretory pathway pseudopilin PulG